MKYIDASEWLDSLDDAIATSSTPYNGSLQYNSITFAKDTAPQLHASLVFKDEQLFDGTLVIVPTEPKPVKIVYEGEPCGWCSPSELNKLIEEAINPYINISPVNDSVMAIINGCTAAMSFSKEDTKLKIKNYEYNKPVTKIDWSDGTTTKVSCRPDEADQFSGFLACICKKLFPDYLKEYEKYTETIPKQKAEEEAKKAEEERIAAKRKAKRDAYKEKRRKIKMAKALAEQYQRKIEEDEIKKIAQEKFGVPKSYFD